MRAGLQVPNDGGWRGSNIAKAPSNVCQVSPKVRGSIKNHSAKVVEEATLPEIYGHLRAFHQSLPDKQWCSTLLTWVILQEHSGDFLPHDANKKAEERGGASGRKSKVLKLEQGNT